MLSLTVKVLETRTNRVTLDEPGGAPDSMRDEILRYLGRTELLDRGSGAGRVPGRDLGLARRAAGSVSREAEDDADAPRAGYRDRIVAAVVVGLILILAAAYVALSRGILLVAADLRARVRPGPLSDRGNRRYRHASPSLRRTIDFSTAFLNASLLAGILIVVNVIAFRYGGQAHRLDPRANLLALVHDDQPVEDAPAAGDLHDDLRPRTPRASRQRDRVVQLLESYKAVNPRMIQLDQPRPVQRPAAARRAGEASSGARVVAQAGRRRRSNMARAGAPNMPWCGTRICFSRSRSTRRTAGSNHYASSFTR